jgi:hypothetical protein
LVYANNAPWEESTYILPPILQEENTKPPFPISENWNPVKKNVTRHDIMLCCENQKKTKQWRREGNDVLRCCTVEGGGEGGDFLSYAKKGRFFCIGPEILFHLGEIVRGIYVYIKQ